MKITATNSTGTITIAAVDRLTRAYTWEGATRSVVMWPRTERWYGSLGLYFPGPDDHWKEHNGITRGVVEEGEQHFKSVHEFLAWCKTQSWIPYVYNDGGLMVGWSKELSRRQLNVEVWQVIIHGKKPTRLPGSKNASVHVAVVAAPKDDLADAVRRRDHPLMTALLAHGASPNSKDGIGTPILMVAVRQRDLAAIDALLQHGANPNARDANGDTVLLEAIGHRDSTAAKRLIMRGAHIEDSYTRGMEAGMTPLIMAAMMDQADIAQLLLRKGGKTTAADHQGNTALQWAAMRGNANIVALLLKYHANVDSRTWTGMTPLMAAAVAGRAKVVSLLIASGANVHARDDRARVMWERAQFMGDAQTANTIARQPAFKVLHEDGHSVLDFANAGRNAVVVQLVKNALSR
jgi:ankyrin repeat protein